MPRNDYIGQVAYEAYARVTGWKTFDGREMPQWHELGKRIQVAWVEAALAAARFDANEG